MSALDAQAPALALRRVLIDGSWHDRMPTDAAAIERLQQVRRPIGAGSAHPAEAGRYHLYVSFACPFAHRLILVRALLGLDQVIGMSVTHPYIAGPSGWSFATAAPDQRYEGVTEDALHGYHHLYEVYRRSDPGYTGRVSIPVLWDRAADRMVSNDSAHIMRALATDFLPLATTPMELYPADLAAEIDALGEWIGMRVNNAVYGVGTAPDCATYTALVVTLFDALDILERRLEGRAFLLGDRLTEADLRLFVTLVRMEPAYAPALLCRLRNLAEFENLSAYVARIEKLPGVADTVKVDHIRRHYLDDDSFIGNRAAAPPHAQPKRPSM